MKKSWMAMLASHYEKTRRQYPQDRLMILFDIDGTILDMRYMILHVLQAFDREHGTRFFRRLQVADITVHENQVDRLLVELQVPSEKEKEILEWYKQHRCSSEYILHSHNPMAGVLEVIRWFQLQPNTFVGLNTGRPEAVRSDTLRSLNELGKEYKVQFSDELLHMNPHGWEQEVENAKMAGVRYFQQLGYRIFAFVDNEPANLKAVSRIDPNQEILLLHANTIFQSKRTKLPSHTVKGKEYDLTELIPEKALPQHIQFVWHGINDEVNLRQFLASDICWGECDVRLNPTGNELILRHDSFKENPLDLDEEWLSL
ncbi:MAG: HAD family hydrolase, partial [bacterium]